MATRKPSDTGKLSCLKIENSLNHPNNELYWANELVPFLKKHERTPEREEHCRLLEEALNLRGEDKKCWCGINSKGGAAAGDDEIFNFWIRYAWLACMFCTEDFEELLLFNAYDAKKIPIDVYEIGKLCWWEQHMKNSPLPAVDGTGRLVTSGFQLVALAEML